MRHPGFTRPLMCPRGRFTNTGWVFYLHYPAWLRELHLNQWIAHLRMPIS